jgi:mycothiol synthase
MSTIRGFTLEDEARVRVVMEASLAGDRIPGFMSADIDRALTRIVPDPGGTIVAVEDGRVVGYCALRHDDLTVHPDHRRRGHGRRLVEAALDLARSRGADHLTLYVPHHLAASQRFAEALDMTYHSSLWQFALADGADVPPPRFPPEVTTRRLAADVPLESFVELLNAGFVGHPTPMSWPVDVIRHVHALPDFDPTDILIVAEASEPSSMVAFARVGAATDDEGRRLGEVRLIGVRPAWRGKGLGRELLRWAVTELRGREVERIELSVEAANDRATDLYRRHGFRPDIEWPHWILPAT